MLLRSSAYRVLSLLSTLLPIRPSTTRRLPRLLRLSLHAPHPRSPGRFTDSIGSREFTGPIGPIGPIGSGGSTGSIQSAESAECTGSEGFVPRGSQHGDGFLGLPLFAEALGARQAAERRVGSRVEVARRTVVEGAARALGTLHGWPGRSQRRRGEKEKMGILRRGQFADAIAGDSVVERGGKKYALRLVTTFFFSSSLRIW